MSEVAQNYNIDQKVSINAFFDVDINGEPVRFQVTSRYHATPEEIAKTTEAGIEAFTLLRQKYPRSLTTPAPAVRNVAEPQTGDTPKKSYEHKPVSHGELPPELQVYSDIEFFSDEFDYFIVEPQPDAKATVKFYKDGLEWAIGASINKWKHESVKAALATLTEVDPNKAEKYRLAGKQFWTKGNEYIIQKGERKGQKSNYKDFRAVIATL